MYACAEKPPHNAKSSSKFFQEIERRKMVGSGSINRGLWDTSRRLSTVNMSPIGVHRRPHSIFWHLGHYGSSSEMIIYDVFFALLFDEASVSPIDGEIQQAGAKNCSNSA